MALMFLHEMTSPAGALLAGLLVAAGVAAGLVLVPHGAHRGGRRDRRGAGLDVLPWQPRPAESMQLDDDRAMWEPHRFAGAGFLADTTEDCWPWDGHPGLEEFAPHAYRRPRDAGGGGSPLLLPAVPWPGGPGHTREVAHDEYTGPALGVPPALAEWAGPVPPTPGDDALAAWVRAELSRQDADTLNYLHDYAAELRAA